MGELNPHDGDARVNSTSVNQPRESTTMGPSTCDDPLPTDSLRPDTGDISTDVPDRVVELDAIAREVREALEDLQNQAQLGPGQTLVIGASSSEVVGKRIGTATSLAVGKVIAEEAINFAGTVGCEVAFQCCEHLNRSLVVKKPLARERGWQEVAAKPVPGAGGAVAASAYQLLPDACLVETITAEAGVDIGDTFIGMHLRRVAVPVRGRRREIGQAHLTMARTRPPLIGGARAVYDEQVYRERMGLSD